MSLKQKYCSFMLQTCFTGYKLEMGFTSEICCNFVEIINPEIHFAFHKWDIINI